MSINRVVALLSPLALATTTAAYYGLPDPLVRHRIRLVRMWKWLRIGDVAGKPSL